MKENTVVNYQQAQAGQLERPKTLIPAFSSSLFHISHPRRQHNREEPGWNNKSYLRGCWSGSLSVTSVITRMADRVGVLRAICGSCRRSRLRGSHADGE